MRDVQADVEMSHPGDQSPLAAKGVPGRLGEGEVQGKKKEREPRVKKIVTAEEGGGKVKRTYKPRVPKGAVGEAQMEKAKSVRKPRASKVVQSEAGFEKVKRTYKPRVPKVAGAEAGVEKVKRTYKPRVPKVAGAEAGVEKVKRQYKPRVPKVAGVEKLIRPRKPRAPRGKAQGIERGGGEALGAKAGAPTTASRKRKVHVPKALGEDGAGGGTGSDAEGESLEEGENQRGQAGDRNHELRRGQAGAPITGNWLHSVTVWVT